MTKSAKINTLICLLLLAIVAASITWTHWHHPIVKDNTPPVLVELSKPQEVLIPNTISSTGNLEAIQNTNLSAKISGYVTKINYHEGDRVAKGALLIQLDNRKELAAVDSAKAQSLMSNLKYQQSQKIYHHRLIAYDDYVTAKTNSEKDSAALETAVADLNDTTIRAPFSGTIGAKTISIGDFIQPGTNLVTLTNLNQLRVTYSVPATIIKSLQVGQPVTLTSPDYPNKTFAAKVSYIAPIVDPSSQTITLHADIDNSQLQLKPGLFVNIHQSLGQPMQATVIPSDALFASIQGYYVLGIKNDKAYKIPVTVGRKLQNHVVITSGLGLNDQFIAQGQNKIQPGSRVQILKG